MPERRRQVPGARARIAALVVALACAGPGCGEGPVRSPGSHLEHPRLDLTLGGLRARPFLPVQAVISGNDLIVLESSYPVRTIALDGSGERIWTDPPIWATDLALGLDGNVYFCDAGGAILVYDRDGVLLRQWQIEQSPFSQWRIDIDSQGNVLALRRSGTKIYKFTPQGGLITTWESPVGLVYLRVVHDGSLLVGAYDGIHRMSDAGEDQGIWFVPPALSTDLIQLSDDSLVLTVGRNVFHVAQDGGLLNEWSHDEDWNWYFLSPLGLAADGNDVIYVMDPDTYSIQTFAGDGTFRGEIRGRTFPGPFAHAGAVGVDDAGNVYALDQQLATVQKFSHDGERLGEWGGRGFRPGQLLGPRDLDVADDGTIYVTDPGRAQMVAFNPDGGFIGMWESLMLQDTAGPFGVFGTRGCCIWRLRPDGTVARWDPPDPDGNYQGIDTGPSGLIHAVESRSHRLHVFDRYGQLVRSWDLISDGDNGWQDVAVDDKGHVAVSSRNSNRIDFYDPRGIHLTRWEGAAGPDEAFGGPLSMTFDHSGNLWVIDKNGARMQRFVRPSLPFSGSG